MVEQIFQIPVDLIDPHPMNPRKDLGDLTELVASIKRSGIMQNLTIVRSAQEPNRFTCLIGHRRLAAAKLAGLANIPATIIDTMSEKDQIATMVAENMQRNDLTITEQASAVQLMLDFGDDFSTIADRTGLSESTVRRRAKLNQYDKKALDKAFRRGASLLDIEKIDQIEDAEKREELLKAAGTKNFNNLFKDFRDKQESKKLIEEISAILEQNGFRPISEKPEEAQRIYIQNLWNLKAAKDAEPVKDPAKFKKKLPADAVLYYKTVLGSWHDEIELYYTSEQADAAEAEKRQEKDRVENWIRSVKSINTRFHNLRVEHIKKVISKGKREKPFFDSVLADHVVKRLKGNGVNYDIDRKYDSIIREAKKEITSEMKLYILVAFDLERQAEYGCFSEYYGKYHENEDISKIYELLAEDGYQQSDAEISYYNGTHPVYSKNPKKDGDHE